MHHKFDPRMQVPHQLIVSVLLTIFVLGLFIAFGTPESYSAVDTSATPFAYLPLVANAGTPVSTTPTHMLTPIASNTAVPLTATNTAMLTPVPPTTTNTPTMTNTPTTQTLPCNSVYPIAINAYLLDDNGFVPPTDPAELPYYGLYSDGTYTNKTQRRLYGGDGFGTQDYHFLAWQGGTANFSRFSAALTGTGTLYQGFDEAPWTDMSSIAPIGYPLLPHQLTEGDWITKFVTTGVTAEVIAALDNHFIHRTVLALPIYDRTVSNGAAGSVHFVRLDTFLLRGYRMSSGERYLDLVYLGQTAPINCASAATATPINTVTVTPNFVTVTPTLTKTATPTATRTSTPTSTSTP